MPLNIDSTKSSSAAAPPAAASSGRSGPATSSGEARPLVAEAIDELTSWNPRELITAFRRWHQGSLSLAHLNVLTLLEAESALSMSRLAEALDISVASMTGIVDRMEARGLVERRHDAKDRRVVLVHPAAGAKTLFLEIDSRRRRGLAQLLEQLSDDELAGLLQGHRALRRARAAGMAAGTDADAALAARR